MIRQFLFLKIYPSKSDLLLEEKKFPIPDFSAPPRALVKRTGPPSASSI